MTDSPNLMNVSNVCSGSVLVCWHLRICFPIRWLLNMAVAKLWNLGGASHFGANFQCCPNVKAYRHECTWFVSRWSVAFLLRFVLERFLNLLKRGERRKERFRKQEDSLLWAWSTSHFIAFNAVSSSLADIARSAPLRLNCGFDFRSRFPFKDNKWSWTNLVTLQSPI